MTNNSTSKDFLINSFFKHKVMEVKKKPNVDLDRYHNIFVEIGLVLALGVCFLAFQWKTEIKEPINIGKVEAADIDTEIIPIVREEQIQSSEPPPAPMVVDVINIVDDDVNILNELEIEDTEADENTEIEITPIILSENLNVKEEDVFDDTKIFVVVEEMPEFPGGELALRKYLNDAVKYPIIAQEAGIEGKVYVNFVIDKDGSVTDASVMRSVYPALDNEALRVVNSMPKWKPGKQSGQYVRVSYRVPINFVLQD